jgi:hypothetical protein
MTGKVTLAAALTATLTLAACGDEVEPPLSQKTITFTEQETENFGFADNPPKTKVADEGPQDLSNGDRRLRGLAPAVRGTATVPGGSLTLARGGRVFS